MNQVTTPCVISPYAKDAKGYARITVNNKTEYHHRVVYCTAAAVKLASIKSKVVEHSCGNNSCINPDHLVVTPKLSGMAKVMANNAKLFNLK